MSENQNNQDSYTTNDFSAVNQFIDDEKSFAQSFHSRIKSEYLRTALLYLSIVIVSIGLFMMFAAYAYHLYKSEKVIVEERVVTETIPDTPFDKIEQSNDEGIDETPRNKIKKEYSIFSSQSFTDSNGKKYEVTTGNGFAKDEYDNPYKKWCYIYINDITRINLYSSGIIEGYRKESYNIKFMDYLSKKDFENAQKKCLMNEY